MVFIDFFFLHLLPFMLNPCSSMVHYITIAWDVGSGLVLYVFLNCFKLSHVGKFSKGLDFPSG